jgi:hypothetical protein
MKKLTISWNKYFVRNQIGIKKDKLTRLIANNIFFNGPQKLAIKNLYPKGKKTNNASRRPFRPDNRNLIVASQGCLASRRLL